MTTTQVPARPRTEPDGPATRPTVRIDRLALGILFAAAGTGWLMTTLGIAVPWRLAAPIALILVGATLSCTVLATGDGGRRAGRSGLAWLGAVLLALSVGLGIDAPRYVAPAGNVTIAPAAAEWPIEVRRSFGKVAIDLTRHSLPDRGTIDVRLGAGNVELVVPRGSKINIDVRVTTGQVVVDGKTTESGVDLRWSEASTSPLTTTVQLAAGEVDIRHA